MMGESGSIRCRMHPCFLTPSLLRILLRHESILANHAPTRLALMMKESLEKDDEEQNNINWESFMVRNRE